MPTSIGVLRFDKPTKALSTEATKVIKGNGNGQEKPPSPLRKSEGQGKVSPSVATLS